MSDLNREENKVNKNNVAVNCSIVIPVYNEEESIKLLFDEVNKVMEDMRRSHEIIFVNDCSSDSSPEIMEELRRSFPNIVNIIHLKERRGQTFAMKQGLNIAHGETVLTMDADLQNDPSDITKLITRMEQEGYDVVCGWRKARQDKPLKAILSKTGNVLQRFFTGMRIHDVSCTLRLYKNKCVADIPLNWEGQHRFIPLSLSLQGYRVGEVVSHHRQRRFGYSKYGHKRIFKVVVDFFRILIARGKK